MHRITIRYRTDITPKMRAVWGSRIMNIREVINPDEQKKYLQLTVEENVGRMNYPSIKVIRKGTKDDFIAVSDGSEVFMDGKKIPVKSLSIKMEASKCVEVSITFFPGSIEIIEEDNVDLPEQGEDAEASEVKHLGDPITEMPRVKHLSKNMATLLNAAACKT